MNLEELKHQTVLYGIYKNGKFKEKCRYSWRQFGNPLWIGAQMAHVYKLGRFPQDITMGALFEALKSKYVYTYEKIAIAITCDRIIIFKKDMLAIATALEKFDKANNGAGFLTQIGSALRELSKNNKCVAAAFDVSSEMPQWKDYRLPETPDDTYMDIRDAIGWQAEVIPLFLT